MPKLLIIDDDVAFCSMLATFLIKKGFRVETCHNAKSAIKKIEEISFDLVITDLRLPDNDGIWLLNFIKGNNAIVPVILMTNYADIATAVNAMKNGAFDYIEKPIQPNELLNKVQSALTIQPKVFEAKPIKIHKSSSTFLKGVSPKSKNLNEFIDLVGPTDMSVLIIGESGTGKENVARSIHEKSNRKDHSFVAVDCGVIPKELAASEFFGHLKGSFTGAINDKIGHFEAANKGTLFLDEIGNLSYETQVQLLRALQELRVKPVGSNDEIAVDVRVIAATNENLNEATSNGTFREDLFHRLNEFSINVPSLKEREDDLMLFANHFLDQSNIDLDRDIKGFDTETTQLFANYNWPGNLRELKNTVKRAVLLSRTEMIVPEVLPNEIRMQNQKEDTFSLYNADNEMTLIKKALEKTDGNKTKAAQLMKIDRKTLYNKLKLYGID
ncbi:sigma-54-dependent transcriptional regulator [Spongiivirga citrea]|uniref:Response regulator n=1 Tax=Spongiivirga citrea TaxID=1481457 RepID=A0A6M0CLU9_9FLAO|nr:sigma-54 dependent transcriptional regulator [Spongiivirga citrea]NER16994.1 response regulator [Spongiivirga citrea]